MKKRINIMSHLNIVYITILVVLSFTVSFLIYWNFDLIMKHFWSFISTIIALAGTFVTLKDISHKFQMFLYRTKVILLNKQIALSLDGSFQSEEIKHSTFKEVKKLLKTVGDQNTIFFENEFELSLSIDGFTIQCSFRQEDNENIYSRIEKTGSIRIFVPEYHAPYVEATVLLENRLLHIINTIKEQIGKSKENFNFQVHFKSGHPYRGIYLKGLSHSEEVSFMCSFQEKPVINGINNTTTVQVSDKRLSLNTNSIYRLSHLIQKHLFLSGG